MESINNDLHLRTKTFIIATNQLKIINQADKVIHINNGRVEFFGTPTAYKGTEYYKSVVSASSLNDQETPMVRIAELPETEVFFTF